MGAEPLILELSGVEREREEKRLLEVLAGEVVGELVADSNASNVRHDAQASARATEEMVKGLKEELEQRGDVYAFLRGRLQMLGLGEGIVSMLESSEVSRRAVPADWSISWEGWAGLVVQLSKVLGADRADAVEEAFGCVSETVRRFFCSLRRIRRTRGCPFRRTWNERRSWNPRDGSCVRALCGGVVIVWQIVCFSC